MNIDITIGAQISKVDGRVTVKDSVIRRTIVLTLAREFDTVLAAAMGKDAKKALALLEVGSVTEVTIPIDALAATGDLKSMGQECHIKELRGVEAKAKADTGEDGMPPIVKLKFETDYDDAVWCFLGRNLAVHAEVAIRSLQLDNGIDQHQPVNRRGKRVSAEA
jgi:hypothetical protein